MFRCLVKHTVRFLNVLSHGITVSDIQSKGSYIKLEDIKIEGYKNKTKICKSISWFRRKGAQ